ncbi:MAG: hypothetical protein H0T05_01825 [Acidobacteria bacterium]|nr:hypothetical protein [Acidobacteriota bacterium]
MMRERRGDPQELGELLREATNLVEAADLRGANELLKKVEAGTDGQHPAPASSVTARCGRGGEARPSVG